MSFNIQALFNNRLLTVSANFFEVNNLYVCSHLITSSVNISEINITKDYVIITTDYAIQNKFDTTASALLQLKLA